MGYPSCNQHRVFDLAPGRCGQWSGGGQIDGDQFDLRLSG